MDYSKLTDQERLNALRFDNPAITNQLPINWYALLQAVKIEPGAAIAPELIDLYIAYQLHNQNIVIPPELNMEAVTPEYYQQLAPVLYLSTQFTPDNYVRAKRIIRIIKELNLPQQRQDEERQFQQRLQQIEQERQQVEQQIQQQLKQRDQIQLQLAAQLQQEQQQRTVQQPPQRQQLLPTQPIDQTTRIDQQEIGLQFRQQMQQRHQQALLQQTLQQQRIVQQPQQIQQNIEVLPLVFTGANKLGDFYWMIERPEYNDVLFLFNDNEEQFLAFINSVGQANKPMGACSVGGGNAIIRPYQCQNPPRAAGIPTGDNNGGYQSLTRSQQYIDAAILYIRQLLETGNYRRVAYSAAPDGTLGTAIFSPSKQVKDYILTQIRSLSN